MRHAIRPADKRRTVLRQNDVATHFCVSDRYVRTVLRSDGISFAGYVLGQRLQLSKQLLKDPALMSTSITEISYRAGFNSASHFGRAFRLRFGVSPAEYRRTRKASRRLPPGTH